MRGIILKQIIVTLLILTSFLPLASGQLPDSSPDWNFDWEDDTDLVILQLDSETYNFEMVLDFFIENSYPFPITIELESEIGESESDPNWELDHDNQISAEANSNETHQIKISGSGKMCQTEGCGFWSANNNFLTQLYFTATLNIAEQQQSEKEITKKLQPSPIFGFDVSFDPLIQGKGPLVKSGTTEMVDVIVGITGNKKDSISKIDMSFRSCPQMNFNSENSKLKEGIVVGESSTNDTNSVRGSIELSAPSQHPDKDCKFIVVVTSEGNGRSYTGEMEFSVENPGGLIEDDSESEGGDNSSTDIVNSDSLPAISWHITAIVLLFSAFIRRELN